MISGILLVQHVELYVYLNLRVYCNLLAAHL